MFPPPPDGPSRERRSSPVTPLGTRRPAHALARGARRGFLLAELLMAMTITAMLSVVLGTMILAVNEGWQYTNGLDAATQQARISMDRIRYMVSQAGVYQLAGQPPVLGVATVSRTCGTYQLSEVLVVWSGGQTGGLASYGVQARLPLISELVIYAPQYDNPSRLIEITSPSNNSSIDFGSATFGTTILGLISSTSTSKVLLSNQIATSVMPYQVGSSSTAGNVRFEVFQTPSATDLQGVTVGSAQWNALHWAQGVYCSTSGLRQANVRIEFELWTQAPTNSNITIGATTGAVSTPYIGGTSYTYAYTP